MTVTSKLPSKYRKKQGDVPISLGKPTFKGKDDN